MSVKRTLIVGLGNPGRKYRHNRHNIGFMVADALAERHGIPFDSLRNKARIGKGHILDTPVLLAKPRTFMNESGNAVGPLANYFKIPPAQLLVIYDELDLPFGTIRLREKGGAGGHNGMKSIINYLGQDFPRIRLGIGRPPGRMDPSAWVLRDFGEDEGPLLSEIVTATMQAVETFLSDGIQLAMSQHNQRLEGS